MQKGLFKVRVGFLGLLILSGCANHPLDCAMGLSLWQGYCPTPGTRGYEVEQARQPQPSPVRTWSKTGATREQFAKDKYACMQESRSSVSSANVVGGLRLNNGMALPARGLATSGETISEPLLDACLEARGYQ
jgi:hypothetical protein